MNDAEPQAPETAKDNATCKGFDPWVGDPCPEPPIAPDGLCLFHADCKNKNQKAFYQGIKRKLELRDCDFRGYCFPGLANFNDTDFPSTTLFNDAKFEGAAFFENARFSDVVGFSGAKFNDWTRFTRAQFSDVVFKDNSFADRVDFDYVTFEKQASFKNVTFAADVSFEGARFLHLSAFEQVKFAKTLSLRYSRFEKVTGFKDINFTDTANFSRCTFKDVCIFDKITATSGIVDFSGSNFSDSVSFNSCKFAGTDFSFASFADLLVFNLVQFLGSSTFNHLKTADDWGFSICTFADAASFKYIRAARLVFENSSFKSSVAFDQSIMAGGIKFQAVSFQGELSFENLEAASDLRFQQIFLYTDCKSISFKGTRFPATQTFDGNDWVVLAKDLIIDFSTAHLDKVVFQRSFPVYLCRFSGSRGLDGAAFEGADWGRRTRIEAHTVWPDRKRIQLLDEAEARKGQGGARRYAEVERLYRVLRRSHTARMDAPQTSDFYYGEMEMRRLAYPDQPARRFWETLYAVFGGYGEQWMRPLFWFLGLVLICSLLYTAAGLRTSYPAPLPTQPANRVYVDVRIGMPQGVGDFLSATGASLLHSVRTAAFLGKSSNAEVLNTPGQVVEVFETMLGPVLLALAALAVRRQFPR